MKNVNNLGIIDNPTPNSSNSNFKFKQIFGKAEVGNNVNEYIYEMFAKDEKVLKSFAFLTDDIVLTNYGIYHYDRRLVGKSINVNFLNFTNIAGVEYSRGGSLSTSGHIKILYKYNIENLRIKISKKDGSVVSDLINIMKNNYFSKIDNSLVEENSLKNELETFLEEDNLSKKDSIQDIKLDKIEEPLIEEEE